jgi:esterase FrsA
MTHQRESTMSFHWSLDPQDLFKARRLQMIKTGLPAADAERVRESLTDMWSDVPGGWAHEWSALGEEYAAAGRHDLAVLAYGWARFPALTDAPRRAAHDKQLESYLLAAADLPFAVERRIINVSCDGRVVSTPIHILTSPGLPEDAPIMIASGGADGWKMDLPTVLHPLAEQLPVRVVLFDIPGTGENKLPATPETRRFIDGLVDAVRPMGNGTVVHFGLSLGGYFSAYSGLSGIVDAAVDCGGPVEAAFSRDHHWPHGTDGILGNVVGFDHRPTPEELSARLEPLSLRPLLDRDDNCPMLVINGDDDPLFSQRETAVFEERRDTQVVFVPGGGHCGINKIELTMPVIIDWLAQHLR